MKEASLNMSRKVGVEFELTMPTFSSNLTDVRRKIAEILTANGVPATSRGYSHAPIPANVDFVCENDSSIRPERVYSQIEWVNLEIKSRIINGLEDWESIVPKMLKITRYLGGRNNRSTGFHVHIDFPEAKERPSVIRSLYNLIHRFEPVLYGLVAPSRRQNGYSRPMANTPRLLHGCNSMRTIKNKLRNWDRRHGLNLTHLFGEHPRIEFRYHGGTLDENKSRMWMYLLNRLVQHSVDRSCQASAEQFENNRKNFDSMRACVGLITHPKVYFKISDELKACSKYWLSRHKNFYAQQSN